MFIAMGISVIFFIIAGMFFFKHQILNKNQPKSLNNQHQKQSSFTHNRTHTLQKSPNNFNNEEMKEKNVFCPYCGQSIKKKAKSCPFCNSNLE